MSLPFPEEAVSQRVESLGSYLDSVRNRGINDFSFFVDNIFKAYSESGAYGFFDHLRVGMYTPYQHERYALGIATNNCTTLIPSLYIDLHLLGFSPQIVQFFGFKTLFEKEDNEKPFDESHFSIVFEMKGRNYLLDPFYQIFGPISNQDENKMVVGASSGRKKTIREYQRLEEWSAKEFHEMMIRLRNPADSLEMLIAGQSITHIENYFGCRNNIWIYYDDNDNHFTTRQYLDSNWLTNKVIFVHQGLDNEGNSREPTQIELGYAKDYTWKNLIGHKPLASLTKAEIRRLRSCYHKLFVGSARSRKHSSGRFGHAFTYSDDLEAKVGILSMAKKTYGRLSEEEQQRIWPMILARTKYEFSLPEQEYLFSQQERDNIIVGAMEKNTYLFHEATINSDQLDLAEMGILSLSPAEKGKLTRKKAKLLKDDEQAFNQLKFGWLRLNRKAYYDQVLDLSLYAKQVSSVPVEEIEREFKEGDFDWRVGYLAMLHDFMFFLNKQTVYRLELKDSMPDLRSRVKERRARINA